MKFWWISSHSFFFHMLRNYFPPVCLSAVRVDLNGGCAHTYSMRVGEGGCGPREVLLDSKVSVDIATSAFSLFGYIAEPLFCLSAARFDSTGGFIHLYSVQNASEFHRFCSTFLGTSCYKLKETKHGTSLRPPSRPPLANLVPPSVVFSNHFAYFFWCARRAYNYLA